MESQISPLRNSSYTDSNSDIFNKKYKKEKKKKKKKKKKCREKDSSSQLLATKSAMDTPINLLVNSVSETLNKKSKKKKCREKDSSSRLLATKSAMDTPINLLVNSVSETLNKKSKKKKCREKDSSSRLLATKSAMDTPINLIVNSVSETLNKKSKKKKCREKVKIKNNESEEAQSVMSPDQSLSYIHSSPDSNSTSKRKQKKRQESEKEENNHRKNAHSQVLVLATLSSMESHISPLRNSSYTDSNSDIFNKKYKKHKKKKKKKKKKKCREKDSSSQLLATKSAMDTPINLLVNSVSETLNKKSKKKRCREKVKMKNNESEEAQSVMSPDQSLSYIYSSPDSNSTSKRKKKRQKREKEENNHRKNAHSQVKKDFIATEEENSSSPLPIRTCATNNQFMAIVDSDMADVPQTVLSNLIEVNQEYQLCRMWEKEPQVIVEKGITYKRARYSTKELQILKQNFAEYWEDYKECLDSPNDLFSSLNHGKKADFEKFKRKTHFTCRLAQHLDRPIWSVYKRAKTLCTTHKKGRFTQQEREEIEKLRLLHGPKYPLIATMLDREPTCIANYFRNHTPPKTSKQWTVGRWTREEEQMLLAGIKAVARTDDLLTTETKNLSWRRVAARVPGRTDVQCFARWWAVTCEHLNPYKVTHDTYLSKEDSLRSELYDTRFKVGKYSVARKKQHLQMLERIVELKPQSLCDINWAELALQFDVATNARILRSQFHRTKNRMVNPKKKSFEDVMGFIKTIFIPKLRTEIEVKLAKK